MDIFFVDAAAGFAAGFGVGGLVVGFPVYLWGYRRGDEYRIANPLEPVTTLAYRGDDNDDVANR